MNTIENRLSAGRELADRLLEYRDREDTIVLALPRGGVPVAFEIARILNLPLDICLVRKLGVPGYRELAMGAIGPGGVRVINRDIVEELNITPETIEAVSKEEEIELNRRDRIYREGLTFPDICNKNVILVDDGIATGATLKAAIETLKIGRPAKIIVAVPVAHRDIYYRLKAEVDELICSIVCFQLHSISSWYGDFSQVSDAEVKEYLSLNKKTGLGDEIVLK